MTAQGETGRSCPECGARLRRWPTLNDEGYFVSCDSCSYETSTPASEPQSPDRDDRVCFRDLLAAQQESSPSDLPAELLDELPQDARRALQSAGPAPSGDPRPISNDMERHLREHGYFVSLDGRGARLSAGARPRAGTGELSAYDLVRLAAEMEGGVPGPEQRVPCPHCQAKIAATAERCPWCGNALGDESSPV